MLDLPMLSIPLTATIATRRGWEEYLAHKFQRFDVDAPMDAMADEPQVVNVPVAAGGSAAEARRCFATLFIGRCPEDARLELVSRTMDAERVVDEMLFSFTHDIEMPWILPNLAPTGRRVEIAIVAVAVIRDGRVAAERIMWDQAAVLAQLGLIATGGPPVLRAAQARVIDEAA